MIERRDVVLLPALAALAVFGVWAAEGGGFRTTVWYPGGLVVLALVVVAVLALGNRLWLPARAGIPLAFITAYSAWSYLSIAWSDVPALAWDGANRTALYAAVFLLFAAFEWRPLAAATWLVLFVCVVAVVATVDFASALRSADPGDFFIGGRYAGPIEYPNGSAGLFLMATWPALVLAAQRAVPWPLRALLAATAAYLVELTLLTESRGAVLGTLAVVAIFLVLGPTRIRVLVVALIVGLAVVLASDALLDVYRTVIAHGDIHKALARAGGSMLVSCSALFGGALVLAFIDARWTMSPTRARFVGRTIAAFLAVAAATTVTVVIATADPSSRVRHAWHQFTATPKQYGVGLGSPSSHFEADPLSGNRYDVWRVALKQFSRAPVTGAGADNFAVDYLRERRSYEEPDYPFSIELRALGQTGLVGAVLLAGFLVSAAFGIVRARTSPGAAVVVGGATLVAAQWLAHGSVDFFWEIPALAAPAFAALAMGTRISSGNALQGPRRWDGRWRRVGVTSALVLALAALTASFVFPWLAAAHVRAAQADWRRDLSGAFADLRRARALNPLSDEADVTAGQIASRRRRWGDMRIAFRRALDRNDLSWYSWLELAVVDAYTHRRAAALVELRAAERLNPMEWTIGFIRYRLRVGRPLSPRQIDRIFQVRTEALTAPAPPLKR